MRLRRAFRHRPPLVRSGGRAFALPHALIEQNAELAIAAEFVTHRRLFGDGYLRLQPHYFWDMPAQSGVFVQLSVPTVLVSPAATKPGDIDLLIVPYEGDELVLDRTLAVELKVVRASYARQGRSPNEYGVSQALGLKAIGFPYVALAHLIVSDQSPADAWRGMSALQVLDQAGRLGQGHTRILDVLPISLIDRTFGRLQKICPADDLGLLSAFVRYADLRLAEKYKNSTWFTEGRPASPNPFPNIGLLERVGDLFEAHPDWWFDNPRRS